MPERNRITSNQDDTEFTIRTEIAVTAQLSAIVEIRIARALGGGWVVISATTVGLGDWSNETVAASLSPHLSEAALELAACRASDALGNGDWAAFPDHRKHRFRIVASAAINSLNRDVVLDRGMIRRMSAVIFATRAYLTDYSRAGSRYDAMKAASDALTKRDYVFLDREESR